MVSAEPHPANTISGGSERNSLGRAADSATGAQKPMATDAASDRTLKGFRPVPLAAATVESGQKTPHAAALVIDTPMIPHGRPANDSRTTSGCAQILNIRPEPVA